MGLRILINGVFEEFVVTDEMKSLARALPPILDAYFEMDSDTMLIGLNRLVLTRARSDGVKNAIKYMHEASEGSRLRREPISISQIERKICLVSDGNSTTIAAAAAGWQLLPCKIMPE